MTIFLICLIPTAAALGFMTFALCHSAAEADRREEALFAKWHAERTGLPSSGSSYR